MQRSLILLTFFALVALTIFGCKKGCTDSNADNYDNDAKRNDGSCEYSGMVVFWYTKATEDSLTAMGHSSDELSFIVDGEPIRNAFGMPNISFSSSAVPPECPSGFFWSFDFINNPGKRVELGTSTSKNVKYEVVDAYGETLFTGTKTVHTNTCNDIKLQF